METTTIVSMKTPIMATTPWSCGSLTFAIAWACGVEPIPASLENRPRLAPWLSAAMMPNVTPPTDACGLKAQVKMSSNAGMMFCQFMTSTTRLPTM